MRKFKLLKDTPRLRAGCVFEKRAVPYEAYFFVGPRKYEYTVEEVEQSPDWFEEIKEGVKTMDDGMDQKQRNEDSCIEHIVNVLKIFKANPRFLRIYFDEIEQEFEERKDEK